jgi:hypothetical protein
MCSLFPWQHGISYLSKFAEENLKFPFSLRIRMEGTHLIRNFKTQSTCFEGHFEISIRFFKKIVEKFHGLRNTELKISNKNEVLTILRIYLLI